MRPHHERVIQRLTELFKDDPRFPALIIGGSIAKRREQENSDVDIMLVATDEEYAKRAASMDFWYLNREICDYPGGYVEGRYIDMQYLRDAADHGSEPTRAAFVGAFMPYSRFPELESLLKQIPVYQEAERRAKIESFFSQVLLLNWFIEEAEKREDRYLLMHATSELVLFGGRLILEHNRILYPYHKWFMYEVRRAADKPDNFVVLIDTLLAEPSIANSQAFVESIKNFQDWGVPYDQAVVHFAKDREWPWRIGPSPVQDW
jgi:hypothetical protein